MSNFNYDVELLNAVASSGSVSYDALETMSSASCSDGSCSGDCTGGCQGDCAHGCFDSCYGTSK